MSIARDTAPAQGARQSPLKRRVPSPPLPERPSAVWGHLGVPPGEGSGFRRTPHSQTSPRPTWASVTHPEKRKIQASTLLPAGTDLAELESEAR